ncbi:hypothetical protein [Pelistega europaea]|uniref:Uncharacterized protein n=1 Tax=Pelistega europaea TaxID=106147 RepID=A0A7Y4LBK9_9BURK|nr:hypothetical protein [Pelistega europaea]NOL49551.1 hypothetical protein [Pelistega europaea]
MSQKFSQDELELLAKTADALSAYVGKPVLAEVDTTEEGYEWVAFGTPLEVGKDIDEDAVIMTMGGPAARLVGASSLLEDFNQAVYECEFLWGIQIGEAPLRFTRIDYQGDEVDWSEDLTMLLPFGLDDDDMIAEMERQDAMEDYGEFDDDNNEDEEYRADESSDANQGAYLGRKIWH